jgi:NTE family protein
MTTAFVLGGGGALGACEVGMLRALVEAGVEADLVLGTSIGAVNGGLFARDPTPDGVRRLGELWRDPDAAAGLGGSILRQITTLARTGTHLQTLGPLRDRLREALGTDDFADLAVPFQCVAASIERAAEHWFADGPLVDAILASSAVPGVLPPVRIGAEHYIDGGVVNSIPVARAIACGADEIYVLQVGRLERPLRAPRRPWEVAMVAFEVARRHRFQSDMQNLPPGVRVHVLPTGGTAAPTFDDIPAQLRARLPTRVGDQIDAAYRASLAELR